MKPEQLKLLAEWIEPKCKTIQDLIIDALKRMDSRPIDMLEDKALLEIRHLYPLQTIRIITTYNYEKYETKIQRSDCQWIDVAWGVSIDIKNEARLNAILNYVEGLK